MIMKTREIMALVKSNDEMPTHVKGPELSLSKPGKYDWLKNVGKPDDVNKIENIKILLELNGGKKSYEDSVVNTIDAIKHLIPNYQDGKIDSEYLKGIVDLIQEQVIPIYDEHFNNDEILGIINFYKTPVGKSYLNKMGIVALETMQIGNKYGEMIYNKMVELFK